MRTEPSVLKQKITVLLDHLFTYLNDIFVYNLLNSHFQGTDIEEEEEDEMPDYDDDDEHRNIFDCFPEF